MIVPAQCHFEAVPVAASVWYRSTGWNMPGVNYHPRSLKPRSDIVFMPVTVKDEGMRPGLPDGVTVSATVSPFSAHFPEAVFAENGISKKMLARTVDVKVIYRWEIHGRPYAYSYTLIPRDLLCFFTVDFMDDKGDGIFRVMTSPGHAAITLRAPPPVPEWARKPKA